jgi:hypothetical protein
LPGDQQQRRKRALIKGAERVSRYPRGSAETEAKRLIVKASYGVAPSKLKWSGRTIAVTSYMAPRDWLLAYQALNRNCLSVKSWKKLPPR